MYYKEFCHLDLPLYNTGNPGTLLCHKRKQLIKESPEERVRQALLHFCEKELGIDLKDIEIEKHLGEYKLDYARRADLLIKSNGRYFMVIECKAPAETLSDDLFLEQASDYAATLGNPPLVWLTNGQENRYWGWNEREKIYQELEFLPDISDSNQIQFEYKMTKYASWNSPSLAQLYDPIYQNQFFSNSKVYKYPIQWLSPNKHIQASIPAVVRLGEALFFSPEIEDGKKIGKLRITRDLSVNIRKFSNPSGYPFIQPFRSFLVEDENERNPFVCHLGLISSYGIAKLAVATREGRKLDLEFDIERRTKIDDARNVSIYHLGTINAGRNYSAETFIDFLQVMDPELIDENGHFEICFSLVDEPNFNTSVYGKVLDKILRYAIQVADYKEYVKSIRENEPKPQKATKVNPLAQAQQLVRSGDLDGALNFIKSCIGLVDNPRALWNLAYDIYIAQNNFPSALQTILEITNATPRLKANYAFEIAFCHWKLYKHTEGLALLESISNHDKLAEYWLLKGWYFQTIPDHTAATKCFEQALFYDETSDQAKMALLYSVKHQYEERVLRGLFNSIDSRLLYEDYQWEQYFDTCIILEEYGHVVKLIREFLQSDPEWITGMNWLADALYLHGNYAEALGLYTTVWQKDNGFEGALINGFFCEIHLSITGIFSSQFASFKDTAQDSLVDIITAVIWEHHYGSPSKKQSLLIKAEMCLQPLNEFWDYLENVLMLTVKGEREEAQYLIEKAHEKGFTIGYLIQQVNVYLSLLGIEKVKH